MSSSAKRCYSDIFVRSKLSGVNLLTVLLTSVFNEDKPEIIYGAVVNILHTHTQLKTVSDKDTVILVFILTQMTGNISSKIHKFNIPLREFSK